MSFIRDGSAKERTRSGIPERRERHSMAPVREPERMVDVGERMTESVSLTSKSEARTSREWSDAKS